MIFIFYIKILMKKKLLIIGSWVFVKSIIDFLEKKYTTIFPIHIYIITQKIKVSNKLKKFNIILVKGDLSKIKNYQFQTI